MDCECVGKHYCCQDFLPKVELQLVCGDPPEWKLACVGQGWWNLLNLKQGPGYGTGPRGLVDSNIHQWCHQFALVPRNHHTGCSLNTWTRCSLPTLYLLLNWQISKITRHQSCMSAFKYNTDQLRADNRDLSYGFLCLLLSQAGFGVAIRTTSTQKEAPINLVRVYCQVSSMWPLQKILLLL